MTFDDDLVRLVTQNGTRTFAMKDVGMDWPPPELISINDVTYRRHSMSEISDEDRASMSHVVRGAEYRPVTH